MPSRKRWYKEVAGVFLLWVEEASKNASDNPPFTWIGTVLRQPTLHGEFRFIREPLWDMFKAESEAKAMEYAELTISGHMIFREYAHRVRESQWTQSTCTEEEWERKLKRFSIGEGWEEE
jgi:hypothetical protein